MHSHRMARQDAPPGLDGPWLFVDREARGVQADAVAPTVVAKVAHLGDDGDDVANTPVVLVRFGDLQYPPAASSTSRKWYSFRPEHGLGPLIAGGWDHAETLWKSTGRRWPRGYSNLDEAIAALVNEWKEIQAEQIKISLGYAWRVAGCKWQ